MSVYDRMTRDELLIAAFHQTPMNRRFADSAFGPMPEAPAQMFGQMLLGSIQLGHLSDDGLRAYLRNDQTALESAFEVAIQNLAKMAMA